MSFLPVMPVLELQDKPDRKRNHAVPCHFTIHDGSGAVPYLRARTFHFGLWVMADLTPLAAGGVKPWQASRLDQSTHRWHILYPSQDVLLHHQLERPVCIRPVPHIPFVFNVTR